MKPSETSDLEIKSPRQIFWEVMGLYRPVLLPSFWYYVAFGIPFAIYGVFAGFGHSFETGDASLFVVLVLVTAMGEAALIVVSREGRRGGFPRWRLRLFIVAVLACLGWNVWFVLNLRGHPSGTVNWIQVGLFIVTINVATWVRFVFVPDSSLFDVGKNVAKVKAYFWELQRQALARQEEGRSDPGAL